MKKLYAPHLKRHVVLGALIVPSAESLAKVVKLKDFRDKKKVGVPTVPAECAWTQPAMAVITNLEGNDAYGDCVEAEEAHFIALVTGNAGTLFAYTEAQTLAMYTALTGFNPSNRSIGQDRLISSLNSISRNSTTKSKRTDLKA